MIRVGLISDTHNRLRPEVFALFENVDVILHAGDIGDSDIIIALEAVAPVHAVIGNTDLPSLRPRAQDEVRLELEGHSVVMVHGHRLGSPTPQGLRSTFPDADIIIYGHTHRQRVDSVDGCLIINPGAAGAARFDLEPSVAILELERGQAPRVEHLVIR